jgi:hypothetical protein
MACAAQHAAFFGHQRKHVSRPNKIGRLARRIDDGQNRGRALLRRDSGSVAAIRAVIGGLFIGRKPMS